MSTDTTVADLPDIDPDTLDLSGPTTRVVVVVEVPESVVAAYGEEGIAAAMSGRLTWAYFGAGQDEIPLGEVVTLTSTQRALLYDLCEIHADGTDDADDSDGWGPGFQPSDALDLALTLVPNDERSRNVEARGEALT